MIIAIVIWLAILGLVYIHYLQGFFSATISALLAIFAALLAIGWHENLTNLVSRGGLSDQAYAITMVGIFVLSYSLMRYTFDKLVPGNVRFPVMVDKIGAPIMGLVAGIVATGVAMIAAQTLPLYPSIGGYSRFAVTETEVDLPQKPGQSMRQNAKYDKLDSKKFVNNDKTSDDALVPLVDDLVMDMVYYLSDDGGTLCGNRIQDVHPDYLQEIFGQRVGIQPVAKHTAMSDWVKLDKDGGVFLVNTDSAIDVEGTGVRTPPTTASADRTIKAPEYKPMDGIQGALVIRVHFHGAAAETTDSLVRMTGAAVRLVARRGQETSNVFCGGVLDKTGKVFRQTLADDVIGVHRDKFADLVFILPPGSFMKEVGGRRTIAPGVFLEIKRLARIDLSGKEIGTYKPDPENYGVLGKKDMPGEEEAKPK